MAMVKKVGLVSAAIASTAAAITALWVFAAAAVHISDKVESTARLLESVSSTVDKIDKRSVRNTQTIRTIEDAVLEPNALKRAAAIRKAKEADHD